MFIGNDLSQDLLIGEQRSWPRANTSFRAIFPDLEGFFREDEVVNISKGGLFIKTRHPRHMNERLEIILRLPRNREEVTVQGQVIHCREGMGIMFTAIEPAQKISFSHFIEEMLQHHIRETDDLVPAAPLNRVVLNAYEGRQSAILCNITPSGFHIRTPNPLVLFEKVDIELGHPDTGYRIEVNGEVAHVYKTHFQDHAYGATIQTPGLDTQTHDVIHDLVREIMLRQRIVGLNQLN